MLTERRKMWMLTLCGGVGGLVIAWVALATHREAYLYVFLAVLSFLALLWMWARGRDEPGDRLDVGQVVGAYRRAVRRSKWELACMFWGILFLVGLTVNFVIALATTAWGNVALYGALLGVVVATAIVHAATLLRRERRA